MMTASIDFMYVLFQAQIHVESILQSLKEIGSILLSRTLVGEEQKKLTAKAMSLLVMREEPDILARTVLTNKGNSFQFTSLAIQLANDTQYIDSQVGTGTIDGASYNFIENIAPLLLLKNAS